ncbi:MAG: hypothetical protein ACI9S9_004832, partial [Planctomycetota bacterium]
EGTAGPRWRHDGDEEQSATDLGHRSSLTGSDTSTP